MYGEDAGLNGLVHAKPDADSIDKPTEPRNGIAPSDQALAVVAPSAVCEVICPSASVLQTLIDRHTSSAPDAIVDDDSGIRLNGPRQYSVSMKNLNGTGTKYFLSIYRPISLLMDPEPSDEIIDDNPERMNPRQHSIKVRASGTFRTYFIDRWNGESSHHDPEPQNRFHDVAELEAVAAETPMQSLQQSTSPNAEARPGTLTAGHGRQSFRAVQSKIVNDAAKQRNHRQSFNDAAKQKNHPLDPAGWVNDGSGLVVNNVIQRSPALEPGYTHFKHEHPLCAGDILSMYVEEGHAGYVGFAGQSYNPKRAAETCTDTARLRLGRGTAGIFKDLSADNREKWSVSHLASHIPKTAPYDLALRCEAVSNVPQIQFNDDDVWHDFAPDRAALKAGPWFPLVGMDAYVHLSDHRVHRPRPTKSAGKINKAPAASAAATDGTGANATGAQC
jgi:hypothetical protein